MCGLAGIVSSESTSVRDHIVESMLSTMMYRGPDKQSKYSGESITFGYNRLRIVGPETLFQPFSSPSGRYIIFFNGEFYNLSDLEFVTFGTRTYSETILGELYEVHQETLFDMLDGMYAIAIWDTKRAVLTLARDFNGEKPLFYYHSNGRLIFGSELNSVLDQLAIKPEMNHSTFLSCMAELWVSEPNTIYKGILCVPKGCFLKFETKPHSVAIKEYSINTNLLTGSNNAGTETHDIYKEVVRAVNSRLISDVPIGTFLSAGLDSSIVTLLAAKRVPSLQSYSVSFALHTDQNKLQRLSDEADLAKDFAQRLGISNEEVTITPDYGFDLFTKLINSISQPYGVSSAIGVAAVAKAAKSNGIKVLLSGDGADEAFAGYSWHRSFLTKNFPKDWHHRFHYYASFYCLQSLFTKDFFYGNYPTNRYSKISKSLGKTLEHDRDYYFSNEMMNKLDRGCMLYSVEGRPPLAAPGLQELAQRIPHHQLMNNDFGKLPLRKAFEEELTPAWAWRKKSGFDFPMANWLSTGTWYEYLKHVFSLESRLVKSGILKACAEEKKLQIIRNEFDPHLLLTIISAELWMETR